MQKSTSKTQLSVYFGKKCYRKIQNMHVCNLCEDDLSGNAFMANITFQPFISFIAQIDGLLESLMRHILQNLPLDFISIADKFALSY